MLEKQVTLTNGSGLHARPAALFVQAAARFKETSVKVSKGAKEVDAKSILGIMGLGAKQGDTLTLRADGPQEAEVVGELTALVEGGFGEA
jgi:phosphocarrier protein HPr